MRCWGSDTSGQLGNNAALTNQPTPASVSGVTTASQVWSGGSHTCARLNNGRVTCWGSDSRGQLGDSISLTNQPTPVTISNSDISTATAVSLGNEHSCALLSGGGIKCWGSDQSGQLGDNLAAADQALPVDVSSITSATQIAVGLNHSCARLSTGSMVCWGADLNGQLGNGSPTANEYTQVTVNSLNSVYLISAGGNESCALLSNNQMYCWGANASGQLGIGAFGADEPSPVLVTGL